MRILGVTASLFVLLLTGCASQGAKLWHQADIAKAEAEGVPIVITYMQTMSPNSAGGVDVQLGFLILADRIKYVRFSATAHNRVGDVVSDGLGRGRLRTMEAVGPYNHGRHPYERWDNVWYNSTIRCMQIASIEIVYMDDSTHQLTPEELALVFPERDIQPFRGEGNSCAPD